MGAMKTLSQSFRKHLLPPAGATRARAHAHAYPKACIARHFANCMPTRPPPWWYLWPRIDLICRGSVPAEFFAQLVALVGLKPLSHFFVDMMLLLSVSDKDPGRKDELMSLYNDAMRELKPKLTPEPAPARAHERRRYGALPNSAAALANEQPVGPYPVAPQSGSSASRPLAPNGTDWREQSLAGGAEFNNTLETGADFPSLGGGTMSQSSAATFGGKWSGRSAPGAGYGGGGGSASTTNSGAADFPSLGAASGTNMDAESFPSLGGRGALSTETWVKAPDPVADPFSIGALAQRGRKNKKGGVTLKLFG
jgi:hypothetical protein